MPRRKANSQMSDSLQQRRKAVVQAGNLLSKSGGSCTESTARHMVDPGVLQNILQDMDAARVPQPSGECLPSIQDIELALYALRDLRLILTALNAAVLQSPALQVVMDECLALLHVGWCNITTWITLCIRSASSSDFNADNSAKVLLYGTDIIEVVVGQSDENRYKQTIISLPSTIDILFLLISLTDSRTDKPVTFCSKSTGVCFIAHLFATYASQEDGREYIISRLTYLGRTQRRRFVSSLLLRVQDAATRGDTAHILEAGGTLFNLFGGAIGLLLTNSLKEDFERIEFALEATRALKSLVEKGATLNIRDQTFWLHMSQCIVYLVGFATAHRASRLSCKVITGGILPCLFYSLPRAKHPYIPDDLFEYARQMLYLMTDSRGYRAVSAAGGVDTLAIYTKGVLVSQESKDIYGAYSSAFRQASLAFDSGMNSVPVCCSIKHKSPPIALNAVKGLKRCTHCRFFFYCSESCQRDDWTSFHSKECEESSKGYKDREIVRLLTPRILHDKLVYLQSVANSCLPSLAELRRQQSQQASTESSVCMFDLRATISTTTADNDIQGLVGPRIDFNVSQYLALTKRLMLWQTYGRVQSLIADMEANKSSIALVEGMFTIDRCTLVSVTATMRYSSHGELRYKVKNSAFRVMTQPIDGCKEPGDR